MSKSKFTQATLATFDLLLNQSFDANDMLVHVNPEVRAVAAKIHRQLMNHLLGGLQQEQPLFSGTPFEKALAMIISCYQNGSLPAVKQANAELRKLACEASSWLGMNKTNPG